MQTEELIRQLAADARPVKRLPPLALRLAGWVVLAAVSLGVAMAVMGVRRELGGALERTNFAVEAVLLILTALSGAVGALIVSVPGAERTTLVRWAPVVAAAAYLFWVGGEFVMAAMTGAPTGRASFAWHCVSQTASVAAVPALALFVMVRKAAPLRATWAGLLAVLSTAAVGMLGSNVMCPNDRPVHLLLWHVAPLMLFAAVGAALGTWLLRWDRIPVHGDAPVERRTGR